MQEPSLPGSGPFEWNAEFEYWKGAVAIDDDTQIELHFNSDSSQVVTEAARNAAGRVASQVMKLRGHVATEFLEILNDEWLEGEDEVLSLSQFEGRLRPLSAVVYDDGEVDIRYFAGELFAGHEPTVTVNGGMTPIEFRLG